MHLTDTMQRYIVHWGEMGSRWGMNRSVAQIHALLYLSEKPLNADEIGETLGIARSNVSTGLKELTSWELVQVTHVLGDRRDFFTAQHDTWEVIRVISKDANAARSIRRSPRCANVRPSSRPTRRRRRPYATGSSRSSSSSRR